MMDERLTTKEAKERMTATLMNVKHAYTFPFSVSGDSNESMTWGSKNSTWTERDINIFKPILEEKISELKERINNPETSSEYLENSYNYTLGNYSQALERAEKYQKFFTKLNDLRASGKEEVTPYTWYPF